MLDCIARIFEPLLRLLAPAPGPHRSTEADLYPPPLRAPAAPRPRHTCMLRGEDTALVRPYLLAHERSEEMRRQRARRRALWLAVHGVDVGPRVIHGMAVPA
ncbi:hypothetical protein [Streptomyces brevispora]|uniref:Uncharacterized protein n=1 Tax=Streptomyces brevispora TaxID=887462 RepID=A0ABZ1GAK7_9ACTN|nr:hypothetical protein [Streptomyces brevispora]WSC15693.1 hypothetical protein OIE64_24590 [Streptomyces brevispora]